MSTDRARIDGIVVHEIIDNVKKLQEEITNILDIDRKNNSYHCFIDSTYDVDIRKFDANELEDILKDFNQLRVFSVDREIKIISYKALSFDTSEGESIMDIEYGMQVTEHGSVISDDKRIIKQYLTSKSEKGKERKLSLVQYIHEGHITEPILLNIEEVK